MTHVSSPAAAAAQLAARLRGARLLHPRGRTFTGEWETLGTSGPWWGAAILDEPSRRPAIVRISKGAPTPTGWPDILGFAVSLPGPVDLLFSSAFRPPLLRHVPRPRRNFGGSYGTILAYRTPVARIFLATMPAAAVGTTLDDVVRAATIRGVALTVAAATRWSRWRPVAVVRFGVPLGADTDATLAFNPVTNHAPDLVPVGRLQQARGIMYRASQRGRGVRPAENRSGP